MRLKSLLVAVGATLVAAMAVGQAEAATVKYTTSGSFAPGSGSSLTIGGSTLAFVGLSHSTDFTGSLSAPFGAMTLTTTSVSPSFDSFNGSAFTLSISQVLPTAGSGSSVYDIEGVVNTSPGSGVINFEFLTAAVVIGSIQYFLPDEFSLTIPQGYTAGQSVTSTVTGRMGVPGNTPNVVPVPPAVLAGVGLMGMVGVRRLVKGHLAV